MTYLPHRIKRDSKECPICGTTFYRDKRYSHKQWAERLYCSVPCGQCKPMWLRLESRVEITPSGCWEWTGAKDHDGYGRLAQTRNGVKSYLRAHRASYAEWVGSVGNDEVVLHTCDNPPCINPLHLRIGSHADNAADKVAKGRAGIRGVLTEDDVRVIRSSAQSIGELAAHYGLSRSAIKFAKSGKTWKHVK